MKECAFLSGTVPNEKALIASLTGKPNEQGKLSVLDEASEESEILHVHMHQSQNGQQVFNHKGVPISVPGDFKYYKLRDELNKKKKCAFVIFDSIINESIVIMGDMKIERVVFVQEVQGDTDKTRLHFLGDNPLRGDYDIIETLWKWCIIFNAKVPSINDSAKILIPFANFSDANKFLSDHADIKFKMWITSMLIPYMVYLKSTQSYTEEYICVVSDFFVKEDKYEDVAKLMPYIKSWKDLTWWRDMGTFEPFYPEVVSVLLWYSVFYMESDRAAFNLILTGKNGCGKTSCMESALKIFNGDDAILSGTTGTDKGLVPSFYGDVPKEGYLASKGFFKSMDEFFRAPVRQNDVSGINKKSLAIMGFLQKIMELITRKNYYVLSGKDDKYKVKMTASFAAADNMADDTKLALSMTCREDPAILRRFTFIKLSESDWESFKCATRPSSSAKYHEMLGKKYPNIVGIPYYSLKRIAEWCRMQCEDIVVDGKKCMDIYVDLFEKEIEIKLSERGVLNYNPEELRSIVSRIDYTDHVAALVKCNAIMRSVYEQSTYELPSIVVKDIDYEYAKTLFKRIAYDSIFLFIDEFQHMVGGGGILRS